MLTSSDYVSLIISLFLHERDNTHASKETSLNRSESKRSKDYKKHICSVNSLETQVVEGWWEYMEGHNPEADEVMSD